LKQRVGDVKNQRWYTQAMAQAADDAYQGEGANPNPQMLFMHSPTAEALSQVGWTPDQTNWQAFLDSKGLGWGAEGSHAGNMAIFDKASGSPVAGYGRTSDNAFWNAALMAGAVTGANLYGAGSGLGAASPGSGGLATTEAVTYGAGGAGGGAGQLGGGLLSGLGEYGPMAQKAIEYAAQNPKLVGAVAGGLVGAAGGESSGGGEAPYSGPMPVITRGGWQPRVQAQTMQVPQFGAGLLGNKQAHQSSGLLRYMGGK
jgi:hypothetical protein